jgi:hypothetical protein
MVGGYLSIPGLLTTLTVDCFPNQTGHAGLFIRARGELACPGVTTRCCG